VIRADGYIGPLFTSFQTSLSLEFVVVYTGIRAEDVGPPRLFVPVVPLGLECLGCGNCIEFTVTTECDEFCRARGQLLELLNEVSSPCYSPLGV
jgi:hypothetical protein